MMQAFAKRHTVEQAADAEKLAARKASIEKRSQAKKVVVEPKWLLRLERPKKDRPANGRTSLYPSRGAGIAFPFLCKLCRPHSLPSPQEKGQC